MQANQDWPRIRNILSYEIGKFYFKGYDIKSI